MGIIEGGSVSGVLPDDRLFAVNYPGYPTSLARATQTLGGLERIAEARSSDSNYLELKFRPEDPCAHAAFGELQQTSDLLLRIKRKPRQNSTERHGSKTINSAAGDLTGVSVSSPNDSAENKSPGFEVRADIIARVEHTYNFDGMADYQYVLAVHVNAAKHSQKRQRDELPIEKRSLMDLEQEEIMMLVPPLFSIKDMPEETVLRPSDFTNKKTKKKNMGDSTVQMEASALPCFGLDFKVKEVPAPQLWENELVKDSVEYQLTAATARLFEERPIWAKPTLTHRLAEMGVALTDAHVKRLLFRTGYYFGYGPFRTLWIKNGYDPREDPESRMYQMLDFRIPRALRESGPGPERRNTKESAPAWMDICSFKMAPQKKFSFLQLFDLQDDFVQEEIRKPAEKSSCSEYTGWFRRTTLERLRQHIRIRYLGLIPNDAARELQRAEELSLQRHLSTSANKSVTWKDDDEVCAPDPIVEEIVLDQTGLVIHTPSELSFTPLPENLSQEEPDPEIVVEPNLPDEIDEDLEPDATPHTNIEEEEEQDDEDSVDEEEDEEEEEEIEDEEDDIEVLQQSMDGVGYLGAVTESADRMPDGFLQELLRRFPFGSNQTPGFEQAGRPDGAEDDDAEYTIFEQADDDEDDE